MNTTRLPNEAHALLDQNRLYISTLRGQEDKRTAYSIMMGFQVDQFLTAITRWASIQSNILALALVGSYARGTAREDSDIDLVLITNHIGSLLDNLEWTKQFGSVARLQKEYYGLVTSIRTWYENGMEVEYSITDERWTTDPLDEGTRQVISDGCRVLFERDGLLSRHL